MRSHLKQTESVTVGHVRVTKRDDSNIEIFPQYRVVLCSEDSTYDDIMYFCLSIRIFICTERIETTVTMCHWHVDKFRVGIRKKLSQTKQVISLFEIKGRTEIILTRNPISGRNLEISL